jgi:predicted exporter
LKLQLSGAPVFSVDSRARIEARGALAGHRRHGGGGALLLVAFASLRPWAWRCCRWPPAWWLGIAAVSLGFGSVHGMTLGFGSTLIGEAVDYAIYYLIQSRRRRAAVAGGLGAPTAGRRCGWGC